jgi:RNA polymerase sigma factor, sigma-70 family
MDHSARMLKMKIETLEAFNPEELFTKEILELVNKAISTLPSKTRDIFIRSRYQNQSYKEIAEELGITVKSVEFEISKAMKILRVTLKDYYPVLLLIFMSDFHC